LFTDFLSKLDFIGYGENHNCISHAIVHACERIFFLSKCSKDGFDVIYKEAIHTPVLTESNVGRVFLLSNRGGKILGHKELEVCYFIELLLTGMWYLTLLFLLQVTGSVIERFCPKHKYLAWTIFYLMIYISSKLWMIHELKFLTPFFVLAIILRNYDWSKCSMLLGMAALFIFIFTMQFYSFECSMYQMTDDVFTVRYHQLAVIRFIAGLSGSVLIIWITTYLQRIRRPALLLANIGTITLPIYVLHQKFLIINHIFHVETTNIAVLVFLTIVVTTLSIALYRILRKNKYLRLLLFGEK